MKWLQLTVPISGEIEDACVNRVQELGATAVFTDSLPDSSLSLVHGIFPLDADQSWILQSMQVYLSSLRDLGFDVPDHESTLREIDEDEYLYQWKEFFQPIHFADTLVVEPVWDQGHARTGEKAIIIDPGMAFGTGQHFTTRFCLQWICEHRERLGSLIDIGCGSGILSIAASILGVKRVVALDHDFAAVQAAKICLELNKVRNKIFLITADVLSLPLKGSFDAVIANLHTPLLLQARESLESLLNPGASLVLTGIGYARQQEILDRYSGLHLREMHDDPHKEWVGIWYVK
ncbi:MAG: 50S ribosomal protein L11 methyltransferase [bacterium]